MCERQICHVFSGIFAYLLQINLMTAPNLFENDKSLSTTTRLQSWYHLFIAINHCIFAIFARFLSRQGGYLSTFGRNDLVSRLTYFVVRMLSSEL